jgi:hypothetical protein
VKSGEIYCASLFLERSGDIETELKNTRRFVDGRQTLNEI